MECEGFTDFEVMFTFKIMFRISFYNLFQICDIEQVFSNIFKCCLYQYKIKLDALYLSRYTTFMAI